MFSLLDSNKSIQKTTTSAIKIKDVQVLNFSFGEYETHLTVQRCVKN